MVLRFAVSQFGARGSRCLGLRGWGFRCLGLEFGVLGVWCFGLGFRSLGLEFRVLGVWGEA